MTTTATVTLRSGPGTTYAILRVVPAGTGAGSTAFIQNGRRHVTYNGILGWIATAHLA